jgi:hypothetical protein
MTFIPKYISQIQDLTTRGVITADYWNNLFNLLIEQGNHTNDALDEVINAASHNLGFIVKDSLDSEFGRTKYLKFLDTVVVEDADTVTVQGIVGPIGPQGPQGNPTPALLIQGLYATYADLALAHPVGSVGEVYLVGTDQTNVAYIWDMALLEWVNAGPLQGTTGPGVPVGGTTGQYLVKSSDVDHDTTWATVTLPSEMQYLSGLTQNINTKFGSLDTSISDINTALGNVQSTITLGASKVVVSDAQGKLAASTLASTALSYLANVSSDIQTQINGKLGSSATAVNATKVGGRQVFVGSSTPAGAVDGDIWFKV